MKSANGCTALLVLVWLAIGGCVVAPPAPTTVELVNSTPLDVRPELYVSGSALDEAGLFVAENLVTSFTTRPFPELRGNETATLTFECEQIRSIGVEMPVMFDAALLIPTESNDRIFRLQGTDFECGVTLRFVYYTQGDTFHIRIETP